MNVEVKTLNEMTAQEWCKLVEERVRVFVVEQECPYQEIDEQDYQAHHLMLKDERGELVGYTRIMAKDSSHVTFGRVLVLKNFVDMNTAVSWFRQRSMKLSAFSQIRQFKFKLKHILKNFTHRLDLSRFQMFTLKIISRT